jgi:uncharacterized membrane protein
MARARSVQGLEQARAGASQGYRTDLIAAYRRFQLQPKSVLAAEQLLRLIPKSDREQVVVMTLGDALCTAESLSEMKTLARINDGFAYQIAKAVLIAPGYMQLYVAYSITAVSDPHSDYAVRMAAVCRKAPPAFSAALAQLSAGDRELIAQHVINPTTCVALALPEADR